MAAPDEFEIREYGWAQVEEPDNYLIADLPPLQFDEERHQHVELGGPPPIVVQGGGGGGPGNAAVLWGPDFGASDDLMMQSALEVLLEGVYPISQEVGITDVTLDLETLIEGRAQPSALHHPAFSMRAHGSISTSQLRRGQIGHAASVRFTPSVRSVISAPMDLSQLVYRFTHVIGAATAAQVDADADWQNPANTIGLRNSTNATLAQTIAEVGSNQGSGIIENTYADLGALNQPQEITKVELKLFARATAVNPVNVRSSVTYSLNNGGSYAQLLFANGAFDHSAANNPFVLDITTAVGGDWAKLDALRVRYDGLVNEPLSQIFYDACELHVSTRRVVAP